MEYPDGLDLRLMARTLGEFDEADLLEEKVYADNPHFQNGILEVVEIIAIPNGDEFGVTVYIDLANKLNQWRAWYAFDPCYGWYCSAN